MIQEGSPVKSTKTNEKIMFEEAHDTSMAQRIVFLRGKMTQKEFAQKVGINPNTLRNYETGRVLPNQAFLATLCYYLNVNPEWILLGQGEPFRNGIKDISDADKMLLSYSNKHYEKEDKDKNTIIKLDVDDDSHSRVIHTLLERNRLYKDNILIREFYYRIMFDILLLSGRYDIIKNDIKTDTKEAKDFFKAITSFFNKHKDEINDMPSVTDILKND